VAPLDRSGELVRVAIHPLANEQVGIPDEINELWCRPGVSDVGHLQSSPRLTADGLWFDETLPEFDGFAPLQATPKRDRNAELSGSVRIKARSARPLDRVGQTGNSMDNGQRAQQETSRNEEGRPLLNLNHIDLERQARHDDAQSGDDTFGSGGAEDCDWLGSIGMGEREKDPWEACDVIGMEMSEEDAVEVTKSPVGVAPAQLSAFSTVAQHNAAVTPEEQS